MLDKWLENKYPEVLKNYIPDHNDSLQQWLEMFHIDLYLRYVEEVVKPVKLFEALVSGEEINIKQDMIYKLDNNNNLILYVHDIPMEKISSGGFISILRLISIGERLDEIGEKLTQL
jgi:hypothetical protein